MLISVIDNRYTVRGNPPAYVADPSTQVGHMAYQTRFIGRIGETLTSRYWLYASRRTSQPVNGGKLTYTDNVSAHGARVVSRTLGKRRAGTVTSLKDENRKIAQRLSIVTNDGRPLLRRLEFPGAPRNVVHLRYLCNGDPSPLPIRLFESFRDSRVSRKGKNRIMENSLLPVWTEGFVPRDFWFQPFS